MKATEVPNRAASITATTHILCLVPNGWPRRAFPDKSPGGAARSPQHWDKGYGPGNCRWASPREQRRNQRGIQETEWKSSRSVFSIKKPRR